MKERLEMYKVNVKTCHCINYRKIKSKIKNYPAAECNFFFTTSVMEACAEKVKCF